MDSLYNHMHGLNLIGCSKGCLPTYLDHHEEAAKWVEILTSLALILTFRPGERVAASGYQSSRSAFHITGAKDVKTTSAETSLVDAVLNDLPGASDAGSFLKSLIPVCRTRVNEYALELVRKLEPLKGKKNLFCWDANRNADVRLALISAKLLSPDGSVVDLLDSFMEQAAQITEASEEVVFFVLSISGILSADSSLVRFSDIRWRWQLKQLGRYYNAAQCLFKSVKESTKTGFNIEIEHLPTPEAELITVASATLNAITDGFETLGPRWKWRSPTFKRISAHYRFASPGSVPNRKIKISHIQHPSITVCLPLLNRPLLKKAYLGDSNLGCCEWCENWISVVSSNFGLDIRRYACEGEYPGDWLIPHEGPDVAIEALTMSIRNKVDELLDKVMKHPGACR